MPRGDLAALSVAPMGPLDVPAVAALQEPADDAARMRDELARPWTRAWVAREGGDVAGPVGFVLTWHVADELHVLNVVAREDRRRRGVGRALMAAAVDYARAAGVRHVLLEVRRSNGAALALYRGLGFAAMRVRARYYPDDEDAIEMALELDAATGEVVPRADEVEVG